MLKNEKGELKWKNTIRTAVLMVTNKLAEIDEANDKPELSQKLILNVLEDKMLEWSDLAPVFSRILMTYFNIGRIQKVIISFFQNYY